MKLTPDNYHSAENKAISNSKVSDFLLSKAWYKAKHIDHAVEDEPTPAMQTGSMVDIIFSTGTVDGLKGKFWPKVKKSEDPEAYEALRGKPEACLVPEAQFWKACEIGAQLLKEDFYQFYKHKKGSKQISIFQQPVSTMIGKTEICGMPDVVTLVPNEQKNGIERIYIDDLKTTAVSRLKSAKSWYWHALDSGYFRQFWFYKTIYASMFKDADPDIVCRHAVIGTSQVAGKYPVRLFVIDEALIRSAGVVAKKALKEIAAEKDWTDPPAAWSSAETILHPDAESSDWAEFEEEENSEK